MDRSFRSARRRLDPRPKIIAARETAAADEDE
jgi:hypothetical protein